jgi:hypothetical protein
MLHDTPPWIPTGTQPVPIGMFRPEMLIPRRPSITPITPEDTLLEFYTFWQHCAPPVGAGGVQFRFAFTVMGTQFTPISSTKKQT